MQNFVNEPFLKKRANYARWGSYVGFGSLFIGLITTGKSPLLAYIFLLIGLFGATLGSYFANRYVREPRADQVLAEVLEGLDKRYALYNYYLPSNHVIASHYGLTVIEPKPQGGEIIYENGRWRHKAGMRKFLQLFGEPSLGKPDQDVEREAQWVKEWIDELMPEDYVPVHGVVVFTDPDVVLHASGGTVPVLKAEELPRYMKEGLKGRRILTTAKQKELRKLLDEVMAEANRKEKGKKKGD